MLKLTKVDHDMFSEYYEGTNGTRKVASRREYANGSEARCFAAAEKALNK